MKSGSLHLKIERTRRKLLRTAEQHGHSFLHPAVLKVSRKLDALIIQAMKPEGTGMA